MAQSILKYQLNYPGLTELELPVSESAFGHPDILSVEVQRYNIVVYVRVDDINHFQTEKLTFFCAETGIDVLPESKPEEGWWFLKTCKFANDEHVIHVFVKD